MTSGNSPLQANEGSPPSAQGLIGLTQEEILERRRRGQVNDFLICGEGYTSREPLSAIGFDRFRSS